jgi:hypothetical protein
LWKASNDDQGSLSSNKRVAHAQLHATALLNQISLLEYARCFSPFVFFTDHHFQRFCICCSIISLSLSPDYVQDVDIGGFQAPQHPKRAERGFESS